MLRPCPIFSDGSGSGIRYGSVTRIDSSSALSIRPPLAAAQLSQASNRRRFDRHAPPHKPRGSRSRWINLYGEQSLKKSGISRCARWRTLIAVLSFRQEKKAGKEKADFAVRSLAHLDRRFLEESLAKTSVRVSAPWDYTTFFRGDQRLRRAKSSDARSIR